MKKSHLNLLVIFLILSFVGYIILITTTSKPINRAITDLSQYRDIRHETYPQWLVGHFPEHIPKTATDVYLLYSPPFMQKGLLLQLWLKLPKEELKKLQKKYAGVDDANSLSPAYPALARYNEKGESEGYGLSQNYEIIELGTESRDDGQHGHTFGLAINDKTSEVLYWSETW